MSEYINFFVRKKESNDFINIGNFCRSSEIFKIFNFAPYEKIMEISGLHLKNAIAELNDDIKAEKEQIKKHKMALKFVEKTNAVSFEEKIENVEYYRDMIKDSKDEIKSYKYFKDYISFLDIILEDSNNHIYVGKEISDPTEEDII